ncbi:MAG: hypothetical protein IJT89_09745, partial [Bacteroidaceae bacterium]|nr:hypothetical protein [Bacteroidaceae bacterium]
MGDVFYWLDMNFIPKIYQISISGPTKSGTNSVYWHLPKKSAACNPTCSTSFFFQLSCYLIAATAATFPALTVALNFL